MLIHGDFFGPQDGGVSFPVSVPPVSACAPGGPIIEVGRGLARFERELFHLGPSGNTGYPAGVINIRHVQPVLAALLATGHARPPPLPHPPPPSSRGRARRWLRRDHGMTCRSSPRPALLRAIGTSAHAPRYVDVLIRTNATEWFVLLALVRWSFRFS